MAEFPLRLCELRKMLIQPAITAVQLQQRLLERRQGIAGVPNKLKISLQLVRQGKLKVRH